MIPKSLARVGAIVVMALGLTGCGRSESFRYKLSLAVMTSHGVVRSSSVVQVDAFDVSIPASGTVRQLHGEALVLDLGAGERPLVVLLTSQLHPKFGAARHWTPDGGPEVPFVLQLYGDEPSLDLMSDIRRVERLRGVRKINPSDLPDLVTFADAADPSTVIEVNPYDLSATLGPNVTWADLVFEITDEPISSGIETRLPWISSYADKMFDGRKYTDRNTLANRLSTADLRGR